MRKELKDKVNWTNYKKVDYQNWIKNQPVNFPYTKHQPIKDFLRLTWQGKLVTLLQFYGGYLVWCVGMGYGLMILTRQPIAWPELQVGSILYFLSGIGPAVYVLGVLWTIITSPIGIALLVCGGLVWIWRRLFARGKGLAGDQRKNWT